VIEVDGGQHCTEKTRDKQLERNGYKVLRFWNNEVLANTEGVLEVIRDCLNHPPLILPSREGKLWMLLQKSLKNQELRVTS
jgi:hypothetical protein